ncbi:ClpP/crotonase-like domain-containing protein [Aspergillus falconensis]
MPVVYTHITVDITDRSGIIKLNRPDVLNAWNEAMLGEMISAFRELDRHPRTVFTVLTGEGRFFSAGADIREVIPKAPETATAVEKKLFYMRKFSREIELFRSLIDHTKILVLALNGPGVGGGAAWFTGLADIVLAASGAYLQVPFNSLGLVPEFGAARTFAQSIGVRRANDLLMFGRKCTVEELEGWGLINRVFPAEGFKDQVVTFLRGQLEVNDGGSMLETKRLMNTPLRGERMLAMFDAANALAERFVAGVPFERFARRNVELEMASKARRGKEKASL